MDLMWIHVDLVTPKSISGVNGLLLLLLLLIIYYYTPRSMRAHLSRYHVTGPFLPVFLPHAFCLPAFLPRLMMTFLWLSE